MWGNTSLFTAAYLAQVCEAAGAETLPVNSGPSLPQDPLLESKQNKNE